MSNDFQDLVHQGVYQCRVWAQYYTGARHFVGYYKQSNADTLAARKESWGNFISEKIA